MLNFKEGKVEKLIGIAILVLVIVIVVAVKGCSNKFHTIEVYGAVGGGKEDLLADEEINKIFAEEYGVSFVTDTWSNGKTVREPVLREDGSNYDLIFFSDQRFYDYYKLAPDKIKGEADRETVLDMIDKIIVYENNEIEIVYKFSDELDYLFETMVEVS